MLNVTISDQIATVTLQRPEKHNAFDDKLIELLTKAFESIEAESSVRVMVLAAQGKNFSAGGDLAWMKRMADYSFDENLADANKLSNMLNTLNNMSIPTIARVQGAAYGGAVGLVSCCDLAIGSENARFCLSEVKVGIIPATISPFVIAAIGSRQARRYFLTAELFTAEKAKSMGLLNEVCPSNELDSTINQLIKTLMQNGPQAIMQAKQIILDYANQPINLTLLNDSSERIDRIRKSKEGQEGLSAFLEKRKPNWTQQKNKETSDV